MKQINLPKNIDDKGILVFCESMSYVPFEIRRVFFVKGNDKSQRGNHAHYQCSQFLICLSGEIRVVCDDGVNKSEHVLKSFSKGLLIEPMIWARQFYYGENAVLAVLCDRKYDENDYIRDYNVFRKIIVS